MELPPVSRAYNMLADLPTEVLDAHRDVVERERDGRLLIGIDRPFARQVFARLTVRQMRAMTGESPYAEKGLVVACMLLTPLLLLAGVVGAVAAARWWAILLVPVCVLLCLDSWRRSPCGASRLSPPSVAALGAGAVLWYTDAGPAVWVATLGFVGSCWTDRLLYTASTIFLRDFVARNPRAWLAFSDGVSLKAAA